MTTQASPAPSASPINCPGAPIKMKKQDNNSDDERFPQPDFEEEVPGFPHETSMSRTFRTLSYDRSLGDDSVSSSGSQGCPPRLSPSMRSEQTPPPSPSASQSPVCPGAPRAPRFPPQTWGSVLNMQGNCDA